jgi:hypothetical protein
MRKSPIEDGYLRFETARGAQGAQDAPKLAAE